MSDTKLDPASLTAEERALLDKVAAEMFAYQPGQGGDAEAAYKQAKQFILARRALFAPENEEKFLPCGCVRCTCENETQCQGCGAKNCAEHRASRTTPPSEMPEAVHPVARAIDALITASEYYEDEESIAVCVQAAEDLESWWRSQPAPAAVAMTPELVIVLGAAQGRADRHSERGDDEDANRIWDAIAAVRAQASQPQVVKLPKVREGLEKARATLRDERIGTVDYMEGSAIYSDFDRCVDVIDAALAELDAAEGREK